MLRPLKKPHPSDPNHDPKMRMTHRLKRGDQIRFGRVRMEVFDIQIGQTRGQKSIQKEESFEISEDRVCRICLEEHQSMENPLIAPCKCDGSLKLIHFDCLQIWLNKRFERIDQKNKNVQRVKWQGIKCELCNSFLQSTDFHMCPYCKVCSPVFSSI